MLMEAWTLWWVWLVLAALLGVAEMLLPGFILLGFAIGALVMALLAATGLTGSSFALSVLIYAVASVVAWWWMQPMVLRDRGNVRFWARDINDN